MNLEDYIKLDSKYVGVVVVTGHQTRQCYAKDMNVHLLYLLLNEIYDKPDFRREFSKEVLKGEFFRIVKAYDLLVYRIAKIDGQIMIAEYRPDTFSPYQLEECIRMQEEIYKLNQQLSDKKILLYSTLNNHDNVTLEDIENLKKIIPVNKEKPDYEIIIEDLNSKKANR